MRVIALGTLHRFVRNRVLAKDRKSLRIHLDSWHTEVSKAEWKTSADLKSQYRSASIVSAERVVFNIKGNDYRLIVAINYEFQIVLVKWLGTHKEYDMVDVEQVMYDKRRYADSSHSDRG